jgi:hypothetical protein
MSPRSKISSLLNLIKNIVTESRVVGNDVFKAYLRTYEGITINGKNRYESLSKDKVIINYEVSTGIGKKLKNFSFYPWNDYNRTPSAIGGISISTSNTLIQNICPFIIEIGLTTLGFLSQYVIKNIMHKTTKDIFENVGVIQGSGNTHLYNVTASRIPLTVIIPFANIGGNSKGKYFLISRIHTAVSIPNSIFPDNSHIISDMGYKSMTMHALKYNKDVLSVQETEDVLYCYRYDIEFNGNRMGLILDSIMTQCEYKIIDAIDNFLNKNVEMYDYIMERKLLKSSADALARMREEAKKNRYAFLKAEDTSVVLI